jgi:thioredoxin 1
MAQADETGREPTRQEIDQSRGPLVLEFGAGWCGYCQALRPHVDALLAKHPGVQYVWVEDGKGKPLGRSFGVKLWPTLVFLHDGQVLRQMSRPEPAEVAAALEALAAAGSGG